METVPRQETKGVRGQEKGRRVAEIKPEEKEVLTGGSLPSRQKAIRMNKLKPGYFFVVVLLVQLQVLPAAAFDVFEEFEKVIWINQPKQVGTAYERGKKLFEFPVVTGDDVTTTNPGIYVIKLKDEDYHSRKYDTPMPYSMFFDLKQRKAIHEGEVPPPDIKKELATHGCIHVEPPYIERLYDWAEENTTAVVISGWRTGD